MFVGIYDQLKIEEYYYDPDDGHHADCFRIRNVTTGRIVSKIYLNIDSARSELESLREEAAMLGILGGSMNCNDGADS